ncbi:hypothetical protein IWW35_005556, partial [Coemansia sp. RSA 1878]
MKIKENQRECMKKRRIGLEWGEQPFLVMALPLSLELEYQQTSACRSHAGQKTQLP